MLKKLKKNKKGFTLAELLIVVAIIGVLVAVSIPIFTSQLEKAREATDVANMRAAKAAAVTAYLSEEAPAWKEVSGVKQVNTTTMYYDANAGKLVESAPKGYGKGTTNNAGNTELGYDGSVAHTNQVITVTLDASGNVTLDWAAGAN